MKIRFHLSVVVFVFVLFTTLIKAQEENMDRIKNLNIYNIVVENTNGKQVKLSEYKGKVLLIVNVASECGNTPQYAGLQKIYETYQSQGFEILAFPCNDFGGQEPGTNSEIKQFCEANYNVTFSLFNKIKVLGEDKSPLYKILTDNPVTGTADIKWNFEKFVISREGDIIARFKSSVKPENEELLSAIKIELAKS